MPILLPLGSSLSRSVWNKCSGNNGALLHWHSFWLQKAHWRSLAWLKDRQICGCLKVLANYPPNAVCVCACGVWEGLVRLCCYRVPATLRYVWKKRIFNLPKSSFLTLVPLIDWDLERNNIETQLEWGYFYCHQMNLASKKKSSQKKKRQDKQLFFSLLSILIVCICAQIYFGDISVHCLRTTIAH